MHCYSDISHLFVPSWLNRLKIFI